jgi:hypothetical protein
VVGLAAEVAFDPNVWPLAAGVILLALPQMVRTNLSRSSKQQSSSV